MAEWLLMVHGLGTLGDDVLYSTQLQSQQNCVRFAVWADAALIENIVIIRLYNEIGSFFIMEVSTIMCRNAIDLLMCFSYGQHTPFDIWHGG